MLVANNEASASQHGLNLLVEFIFAASSIWFLFQSALLRIVVTRISARITTTKIVINTTAT